MEKVNEKHRNWKVSYGTTIHAFGSKEWSKGKLLDLFLKCLLERKTVRVLISTCPPFKIPIHEETKR